MGLLDELERRGYGKRPRQRVMVWHSDGTYRITTPQALGRQKSQQRRRGAGIIVGAVGWFAALFLSSYGPVGVLLGVAVGVLFTVAGLLIAFSHNDREVKRHARWTWREFKKFLQGS